MTQQTQFDLTGTKLIKFLKKTIKGILSDKGLNPSTYRGNKELDILVKRLAKESFTSLADAKSIAEKVGESIFELSQQKGKTHIDKGIIQQVSLQKSLFSLPSVSSIASSSQTQTKVDTVKPIVETPEVQEVEPEETVAETSDIEETPEVPEVETEEIIAEISDIEDTPEVQEVEPEEIIAEILDIEDTPEVQEVEPEEIIAEISDIEETPEVPEVETEEIIAEILDIEDTPEVEEVEPEEIIAEISDIEDTPEVQEVETEEIIAEISDIEDTPEVEEVEPEEIVAEISDIEDTPEVQEVKTEETVAEISDIEDTPEVQEVEPEETVTETSGIEDTPEEMRLKERLTEDIKLAMKAKDKIRLETVRSIKKVVLEKEVDVRPSGQEILTPDQELEILAQQAKQRRESIEQFRQGGRDDLADKEAQELAIIETYLPPQLSDEEIGQIIDEIITSVGATSAKEMGKVMGSAMQQLKGKADGKKVQELVKLKLV